MATTLPSVELVLDEARVERAHQLVHFEALDAKAGGLLGFAGALVALAPDRLEPLIVMGRVAAVLSGLAALGSFWPRTYWLTDLRALRDKYLTAEVTFTQLKLLDATVAESEQVRGVVSIAAAVT